MWTVSFRQVSVMQFDIVALLLTVNQWKTHDSLDITICVWSIMRVGHVLISQYMMLLVPKQDI